MKPLTIKEEDKVVNAPPKAPSKMVDIETARQMASEAAREAADLATKESMEGFRRFQEQNQIVERPGETAQPDPLDEQMVFDKGAFRSVSNTMRAIKSMQDVFTPPPSKIEQAVQNVVENVSTDIATKMLGGGLGGTSVSKGFIGDLLHEFLPAFGHGLGESLGANGPETVKSLIAALSRGDGQPQIPTNDGKQPDNTEGDKSNTEKQKDMVLVLDSNKPEDIKQYATAMGLSEKAAREMLVYHQQDIVNERKASGAPSNSSSNSNEIVEAIKVLTNEMSGMKGSINSLQGEIIELKSIKGGKTENLREEPPTYQKWTEENGKSPTNKSVTLFQEPIKVDIDAIKGENLKDSFFDDKQEIKEAEIIREDKKEEKDTSEHVIDKKEDSHPKTTDSESDKKKEETNLGEAQQTDDDASKVEQKAEQKPEVQTQTPVQHKRIIRKAVVKKEEPLKEEPIKEETQETVSDEKVINNNETI